MIEESDREILELVLEKVDKKIIRKKDGFVNMKFGDGGELKVAVSSDRTIFYNQALYEVKDLLKEIIERCP
jgi:hypothetical protein